VLQFARSVATCTTLGTPDWLGALECGQNASLYTKRGPWSALCLGLPRYNRTCRPGNVNADVHLAMPMPATCANQDSSGMAQQIVRVKLGPVRTPFNYSCICQACLCCDNRRGWGQIMLRMPTCWTDQIVGLMQAAYAAAAWYCASGAFLSFRRWCTDTSRAKIRATEIPSAS
jgi:hypothetical protein